MKRSRQIRQLINALAFSILPVLVPALAYWAAGGREVQWRLILAGVAWAAGYYTQIVATTRKKRRFLLGSGALYLIGAVFSFTVLGPVSVAFTVLYVGLLAMLWLHKNPDLPSPAAVLSPAIALLTGAVLTLGVLAIRLSL